MALLTHVIAIADDRAFLDSLDPRKGGDSITHFSYMLGMETLNQHSHNYELSGKSGLDDVMDRLEGLRSDSNKDAALRKQADEVWDMVIEVARDIKV
ncbi:MAG: hypothetical protein EBV03_06135 [Proteobacteria bacterium]|nr:hypothetical protein [Pseudomonadota bacterium]